MLNKLQNGSCSAEPRRHDGKTNDLLGDTGCRGGKFNNFNSNSWSLKKSSRKNTFSSRSCSPITAMPIRQQHLQRALQSFSCPFPTTSIEDAPSWRLCLASRHPTTKYPAITTELLVTLINTPKANLLNIARRPKWYPSNSYWGWWPPKYGSTLLTRRPVKVSNIRYPPATGKPPPISYATIAFAKSLPSKT